VGKGREGKGREGKKISKINKQIKRGIKEQSSFIFIFK